MAGKKKNKKGQSRNNDDSPKINIKTQSDNKEEEHVPIEDSVAETNIDEKRSKLDNDKNDLGELGTTPALTSTKNKPAGKPPAFFTGTDPGAQTSQVGEKKTESVSERSTFFVGDDPEAQILRAQAEKAEPGQGQEGFVGSFRDMFGTGTPKTHFLDVPGSENEPILPVTERRGFGDVAAETVWPLQVKRAGNVPLLPTSERCGPRVWSAPVEQVSQVSTMACGLGVEQGHSSGWTLSQGQKSLVKKAEDNPVLAQRSFGQQALPKAQPPQIQEQEYNPIVKQSVFDHQSIPKARPSPMNEPENEPTAKYDGLRINFDDERDRLSTQMQQLEVEMATREPVDVNNPMVLPTETRDSPIDTSGSEEDLELSSKNQQCFVNTHVIREVDRDQGVTKEVNDEKPDSDAVFRATLGKNNQFNKDQYQGKPPLLPRRTEENRFVLLSQPATISRGSSSITSPLLQPQGLSAGAQDGSAIPPRSRSPRPYARTARSLAPTIKLIIDNDKQHSVTADMDLLLQSSSYFTSRIREEKHSTADREFGPYVNFPNSPLFHMDVLGDYVEWLSSGIIPYMATHFPVSVADAADAFDFLACAYVFGEHINAKCWMNDVMDAFILVRSIYVYVDLSEIILFVYEHTGERSQMRRLLVDMAAHSLTGERIDPRTMPVGYTIDVAQAIPWVRPSKKERWWQSLEDGGLYHV